MNGVYQPQIHPMNCTHNNSSNVVCTNQELSTLISMQFYTVFALGAGLCMYKSFTAENWADIAVQLGWGCVSAFTHTKRFAFRYVIPGICATASFIVNRIDKKSKVETENNRYVHVVKDGVELHSYSSIFTLIKQLENTIASDSDSESDSDSDSESEQSQEQEQEQEQSQEQSQEQEQEQAQDSDDVIDVQNEDEQSNHDDNTDNADNADNTCCMRNELARIVNHTMQFDFVMCQVPTPETAMSETPQCMYVIKYDGFPRESDGSYFFERKFTPSNHRMIEIALNYNDSEYELNLSSPDNFYVIGNKLLEPAFLKWFMRKNHGVSIDITSGGTDNAYTIKCVDNHANLQTLKPCNYLRVTETGFEVLDSGLV